VAQGQALHAMLRKASQPESKTNKKGRQEPETIEHSETKGPRKGIEKVHHATPELWCCPPSSCVGFAEVLDHSPVLTRPPEWTAARLQLTVHSCWVMYWYADVRAGFLADDVGDLLPGAAAHARRVGQSELCVSSLRFAAGRVTQRSAPVRGADPAGRAHRRKQLANSASLG